MALGVVIFALAMVMITSSDPFYRFSRKRFVRRTLYIGYGLRVGVSMIVPLGMMVDVIPGMVSVRFVDPGSPGFLPTLLTTLVQGTLLNLILSILMAMIWGGQAIFAAPRPPSLRPCAKCGYDLLATEEDSACPECGSTAGEYDFDSTLLSRTHWWKLFLLSLGVFFFMATAFLLFMDMVDWPP
ncbi:MAG: hypothetical protein MK085_05870 [Phycisphaerales bacterium]|nr:hypothetical protein [Phycisphaerales bacterium]